MDANLIARYLCYTEFRAYVGELNRIEICEIGNLNSISNSIRMLESVVIKFDSEGKKHTHAKSNDLFFAMIYERDNVMYDHYSNIFATNFTTAIVIYTDTSE